MITFPDDEDEPDTKLEKINYWRFCHSLSIFEATLLLLGHDPDGHHYDVERKAKKPDGYVGLRQAITSALAMEIIDGNVVHDDDQDRFYSGPPTISFHDSVVELASLKKWVVENGVPTQFFDTDVSTQPGYLDPANPRFAPKLAAAVQAWEALGDESKLIGTTPKKALEKWLRLNAKEFDLSDEDGKPNESGIEQICKVANWKPGGGAPSTPE